MSKTNYAKCSNFFISFLTILIHFCISAPINVTENAYTQFVDEFNHKCSIPNQVQLPFNVTKVDRFEYLLSYLKICQNTESTKHNKEAIVFCKEIFDSIRNISCSMKTTLPVNINVNLSNNVCQDINDLKKDDSLLEDESLLKRLTDGFLCDIICDNDFENACQVLLWSFKVQKQIASIASSLELELFNMTEYGEDINGENKFSATASSFKPDDIVDRNDLPETSVYPEHEKKNAEEAKDVNKVVEHDRIPKPSKLENNLEEKLNVSSINNKKDRQKPIPNNEGILENQVPNSISQDSTGASKSTSSTKTPDTFSQEKIGVQSLNSNAEVKHMQEMEKGKSHDNVNKQLKSDLTKYDQVHAGNEFPQASNIGVIKDEQVNANVLVDNVVQDKKNTNILVNKYLQDTSNNNSNQNIPLDDGNFRDREVPDEITQDQKYDFLNNNNRLQKSADKKSPNDTAALHVKQNLSNLVNIVNQNEFQRISSNEDNYSKKINSTTTNSQTIKGTTQQQTYQESMKDKTSISENETKADQPLTNSALRKIEKTQYHTKTDLITDDRSKNPSTNQKKSKVVPQTEELDIITNTAETLIDFSDKKPTKKNQKSEPTAMNPDDKNVIPSSLPEISTETSISLEKMEGDSDFHQPAVEDAEHYGDPENIEGDEYQGPDYDGGFNVVSKNKASNPDFPTSITAAKEIITSQDEKPMEFPSRNAFGQYSNDIPMISAFPEQENSHFFFYFLSIVLILMAGYLMIHNKQKIIALIVEGRHERNRRSHRNGYKKLETK